MRWSQIIRKEMERNNVIHEVNAWIISSSVANKRLFHSFLMTFWLSFTYIRRLLSFLHRVFRSLPVCPPVTTSSAFGFGLRTVSRGGGGQTRSVRKRNEGKESQMGGFSLITSPILGLFLTLLSAHRCLLPSISLIS